MAVQQNHALITSAAGIALIKKYEGLRLKRYTDSAGYPTIGYGHKLLAGEHMAEISIEQAERLLARDLIAAEDAVRHLAMVPLSSNQFSALVCFVFNLGRGYLAKSTLLRLLNEGNFDQAAQEFDKWVFAGGKRVNGLVKRREAEKQLFLTKET